MKVSIRHPDLSLANMLLQVRDHLFPRDKVSNLPAYLDENAIGMNELADQSVEDGITHCPICFQHVHPIQRDEFDRRKICAHQRMDSAWIHHVCLRDVSVRTELSSDCRASLSGPGRTSVEPTIAGRQDRRS